MFPFAKTSRIEAVISSRPVAAISGGFLVLLLLGCMNFAVGNRGFDSRDDILEQKGEVHLGPKAEQDVYYPVPYANVPNIELTEDFNRCMIVEQKEDHFRIQNTCSSEIEPHWHARGMRMGFLPPAPPPIQPVVKSARPDLPSQPMPAQ